MESLLDREIEVLVRNVGSVLNLLLFCSAGFKRSVANLLREDNRRLTMI